MICIGIDPAPHGFHAVALMRNAEGEVYMETYSRMLTVDRTRFMAPSESMFHTHLGMDVMIDDCQRRWHDPDEDNALYVFCEAAVVAGVRNLQTTIKMAMAVSAIVTGAMHHTQRVYLVPVSKWKVSTCGNGSAGKPQVADWLNHTHPEYAAACDGSQDLKDACCIALYGLGIIADAELVRTVGSTGQL